MIPLAVPCQGRVNEHQHYAIHLINQLELRHHQMVSMRPDDRERMYQLCALIEKENDHRRFLRLIEELNELLGAQEQQLETKNPES